MKRFIEWWNQSDDLGDGYEPPVTNGDIVLACSLVMIAIIAGILVGIDR